MEKKTNKAKLENLKVFEKISFIARLLIRVFLHAEFISAKKTIQIPTIFVKNAKEQKNE